MSLLYRIAAVVLMVGGLLPSCTMDDANSGATAKPTVQALEGFLIGAVRYACTTASQAEPLAAMPAVYDIAGDGKMSVVLMVEGGAVSLQEDQRNEVGRTFTGTAAGYSLVWNSNGPTGTLVVTDGASGVEVGRLSDCVLDDSGPQI